MFDFIEVLKNNVTGLHLDSGYTVIIWEDLSWLEDTRGGLVWVQQDDLSYRAY